jgi:hypothetical protein
MSFCKDKVHFPYFTITRVSRDINTHYAFIGDTPQNMFNNLNNKELLKIFDKECVDLWKSIVKNNEKLYFINDRIWLDDSIYTIKNKIFIYLSKDDDYIPPEIQELWLKIDDKNVILGNKYEKEEEDLIFEPHFNKKPQIDNDFITDTFDKNPDIIYDTSNIDSSILYDEVKNKDYELHLFCYSLKDELRWINSNYPEVLNNEKELWNGFIYKYWPLATEDYLNFNNISIFNQIRQDILSTKNTLKIFREEEHKGEPVLNNCILYKINFQIQPLEKSILPLDLIYIYLRTLLSKDIPFIFYLSPVTEKKVMSFYDKSLKTDIDVERFKTFTQLKEKGIVLKILNYVKENNKKDFFHLLIKQDNSLTMYITYDKNFKGDVDDIEKTMNKVINIIKKINNDFLEPQKLTQITLPYLKFKDNDFITNEETKIQYFNAIIDFETKNKINYNDFSEYINRYKDIANIPPTNKDLTKLIIKYNRITNYQDTLKIFEYIQKEIDADKNKEDILKSIQELFGKTRKKASEMYTDYSIQKYDRESSAQLLDDSGTKIQL